jgi:hypothetical protein
MAGPKPAHAAGIVPGGTETCGDMIFSLAERQDRIAAQINKKIERLDRRITVLEERGRS